MNRTPIVMLVYNRPWHTCQTVEALKKNTLASETDLYIFLDAVKITGDTDSDNKNASLVAEVRNYIKNIDGFKSVTITEREKNLGLHQSMIFAVTEIINRYGQVIVLEDDIVTSPFFLQYMNDSLDFYKNEPDVFHISSTSSPIASGIKLPSYYAYDTYFLYRALVWGWATWQDRWNKGIWDYDSVKSLSKSLDFKLRYELCGAELVWAFNKHLRLFNENIKQLDWEICWTCTINHHKGIALTPVRSYILNIGLDGTGLSCDDLNDDNKAFVCDVSLAKEKVTYPPEVKVNKDIAYLFNFYYRKIPFLLLTSNELKNYWSVIRKENQGRVSGLDKYDSLIYEIIVPIMEKKDAGLRRKIILYGIGDIGKNLINIDSVRKNISYVIDDKEINWGQKYKGISIYQPEFLISDKENSPFILVTSTSYNFIKQNLIEKGFSEGEDFIDISPICNYILNS